MDISYYTACSFHINKPRVRTYMYNNIQDEYPKSIVGMPLQQNYRRYLDNLLLYVIQGFI